LSLDADHIVDRRRMRRKLTFWRVLAVVVAIVAIVAAAVAFGSRFRRDQPPADPRVTIRGVIRGDQERVEALRALSKQRNARAVIVHVDSPGGTTAGSEQLYDALRRMSERQADGGGGRRHGGLGRLQSPPWRPITSSRNARRWSARSAVLFQYPNVADLMKTIGVQVGDHTVDAAQGRARRLRADQPGGARGARKSIVMDSYAWFRGMVAGPAASSPARISTGWPTDGCSPAARPSTSS